MKISHLIVLLTTMVVGLSQAASLGDRLLRTFKVFHHQPVTESEAQEAGWTSMVDNCTEGFGVQYAPPGGITADNSVFIMYTAAGQLAGFGVRVYGVQNMPSDLNNQFWKQSGDQQYDVYVLTRDPTMICSSQPQPELLGDRLLISGHMPIPLTMAEAESSGWYQGNCIGEMGIHHSYDLSQPGGMTFNASTLVPLMPMYDAQRHTINAVLFQYPEAQRLWPVGDWEGPIFPSLMCYNWCKTDPCNWPGVEMFATMHWHFVDPSSISCSGAKCSL